MHQDRETDIYTLLLHTICSHASAQRDKEVKVQPQWVHHQQALAREIRGEQPAARRERGPCGAERANDNRRRVRGANGGQQGDSRDDQRQL